MDKLEAAQKIYEAAVLSSALVSKFTIPTKTLNEGPRQYLGRIADEFEAFCRVDNSLLHLNETDFVSMAADAFLRLAADNYEL